MDFRDGADAVRFSLLGGDLTVGDDELSRLYAYPPVADRCVVRANAIASLDGAATTGGSADDTVTTTLRATAGAAS